MELKRFLQITNSNLYAHIGRRDPWYNKIHQTRWLLEKNRNRCKAVWNLGKNITIDEMMIWYKGNYSPICQYMPIYAKKISKMGLEGMVLWVCSFQVCLEF